MIEFEHEVCFICDNIGVGERRTVKERGLHIIKEASAQRRNEEHIELLQSRTEVSIHTSCYKKYVNPRMIVAAAHRSAKGAGTFHAVTPMLRSKAPVLKFEQLNCCLCGEGNLDNFEEVQRRLPERKRNYVLKVKNHDTKQVFIQAAKKREDEWGNKIVERISQVNDLVASGGWYHRQCHIRLYSRPKSEMKRGFRPDSNVDEAMQFIFNYLEEHSDECQFNLHDLISQIEGDYCPDPRTVTSRLIEHYGDDILIVNTTKRGTIVCFRHIGYKLLSEGWYNNRETDPQQEKLRIVQLAGDIIKADIRSQVYDLKKYPPPNDFLNDVDDVIPESLKVLLETIIMKDKRGALDSWKRKCTAIAHSIISATRPRSFLSSLLTGLTGYLYRKFGSRHLITMLSHLGFSASYSEGTLLEASAVLHTESTPTLKAHAFCQTVFDNADWNTMTLDGKDTFHMMGGILCISPDSSIIPFQSIDRVETISALELLKKAGKVKLVTLGKSGGLQKVPVKNLDDFNQLDGPAQPLDSDVIWLYAKWKQDPRVPGWNGFMEKVTAHKDYKISKIICLPFINNPPSSKDTIYTSLLMAIDKCKILGQKQCIVTFDQPLYIKAREISALGLPELSCVTVRLGGFHLAMSFMGAIGMIMSGSGLQQLLTTIYAEISVQKIMNGHAYSRAVRGHLLIHGVLGSMVWETIELTDEELVEMNKIIDSHSENSQVLSYCANSAILKKITEKFAHALNRLESNGPTAKLWVTYFRMVTILKQFIQAERTGNWKLHLQSIQQALPYFHAAGHNLYAKSAHLYLTDMLTLEQEMDPVEYYNFTTQGGFTVRRSKKYWAGIWSDQTIEQTLMKDMKSHGGLTRGRGFSEGSLAKWTLAQVYMQGLCDELEKFCNVHFDLSEQHVDLRTSRMSRDERDSSKLLGWLSQHHPFSATDALMSLSSGIVGGPEVNCHLASEVGAELVSKMVEHGNFQNVSFRRKDKVITLASVNNSLKFGSMKVVSVDPLTLFQRLCLSKPSDADLKEFFKYELAPFPMSIFDEEGMRKGSKSTLYKAFSPLDLNMIDEPYCTVVDGGFLLHKVVWSQNTSFQTIAETYSNFIKKHYGPETVVVFDGYPDNPGTKQCERSRRAKPMASVTVLFDHDTMNQVAQDKFLANEDNKKRLIKLLSIHFKGCNIEVKQASEDADILIVQTALNKSKSHKTIIVGEDIDLLVLMTALGQSNSNIFFLKPGRGKTQDVLYGTTSYHFDPKGLLLSHALSGCDTTSAIFGQGKMKICNLLSKASHLQDTFYNPTSSHKAVEEAGEALLMLMYSSNMSGRLDELRFVTFQKLASRKKVDLPRLPPTSEAAKFHSYRTYLQVQVWLGNQMDPVLWGWSSSSQGLSPTTMMTDCAPQTLLNTVSCACKGGCSTAGCSCKKAGLKCSSLCKHCTGLSCENTYTPSFEENKEDEVIDDREEMLYLEEEDNMYHPQADNHENPTRTKRRRRSQ